MQSNARLHPQSLPTSFRSGGERTTELSRVTIEHLIRTFYTRVAQDDLIGPLFRTVLVDQWAWQSHCETMVKFWESLLLGSKTYRGRTVAKHQMLPTLSGAMFDRWHALFEETTRGIFETDVANRVVRIAQRAGTSIRKRTVPDISV